MQRHTSRVGHFKGVSGSDAIEPPNQVSLSCLLCCTSVQTWTLELYLHTHEPSSFYRHSIKRPGGNCQRATGVPLPCNAQLAATAFHRCIYSYETFLLKMYVLQLGGVH